MTKDEYLAQLHAAVDALVDDYGSSTGFHRTMDGVCRQVEALKLYEGTVALTDAEIITGRGLRILVALDDLIHA